MRPCLDTRFRILGITNAERVILSFLNIKKFDVIEKIREKEKHFATNIWR